MKRMRDAMHGKRGQAMVEYIIIVVIVAIAALVIFGLFSDTIRQKLGFAVEEMGGDAPDVSEGSSLQYFQEGGTD
jgi:Flp pilus assembly pilin Flp